MTTENKSLKHVCIIGQYYDIDDSRLVTYSGVVYLYDYNHELTKQFKNDSSYGKVVSALPSERYRLIDYFDKRKSVNMRRFEYCPYCGKKIDWKKLRERAREDEVN